MQDCYIQKWCEIVGNTAKLRLYHLFKTEFRTEMYLLLNIPWRLRKNLSILRTSFVDLEIEKGRREGTQREDRICKFCRNNNEIKIEDEYHVVLECKAYVDARHIYLGNVDTNLYFFQNLMKTEDRITLIKLANFTNSVIEIRKLRKISQ